MIIALEAKMIVDILAPQFASLSLEYDFGKYPEDPYRRAKVGFSSLSVANAHISDAMRWKWGHWGKANFPQRHWKLIADIESAWPIFISSVSGASSLSTFYWWTKQLDSPHRYITVAFITHLIHHQEAIPIIDQHNFRAMNSLIINPALN